MKEYKRLTKKEGIGRFVKSDCITCKHHKDDITGCDFCEGDEMCNNWCCGVLYNRLAELEDKIENGTLVELPENAVVLSEEEYEELKFAKKLLELREEDIKSLEDANIRYAEALELKVNKKERKETAREFATTLISVLWEEEKDEKIRIKDVHGVIRDILNSEYGVDMRVVEE